MAPGKQKANPYSTGGGGGNFEAEVQASFVILMLTGGFAPCVGHQPIQKIQLQTKNFQTDDLIVFTGRDDRSDDGRLLAQVKHEINITEKDRTFSEVIHAAWGDFLDPQFRKNRDVLALITGPLSSTDINHVRRILEWARSEQSANEFIKKVNTTRVSSEDKAKKLAVFRLHLEAANGGRVEDEQLHEFLRHFHLLGYDLDIRAGVMHAVLHSLIGQYSRKSAFSLWAQVVREVRYYNQDGGTITRDSLPGSFICFYRRSMSRSC